MHTTSCSHCAGHGTGAGVWGGRTAHALGEGCGCFMRRENGAVRLQIDTADRTLAAPARGEGQLLAQASCA